MSLPSVTVITTTGHRPKCFALTEKYMARQTYKGQIQWIVVSDDNPATPTKCTMGQEYIPGPLIWQPETNTQRYSLAAAIPHIKGDVVIIWEDDDFFRPEYIETMVDFLKYADLVGECNSVYYSVRKPNGYWELGNTGHASLTQTAFKKSYIPRFQRAVHSGEVYIDLALWNRARRDNHKRILFSGMNLCLGMKGVHGERTGIGVGHQDNNFTPDPGFHKLKHFLGEADAQEYIKMMKG